MTPEERQLTVFPLCRCQFLLYTRTVVQGPVLFYGVQFVVTVDGAAVDVWDGVDVTSGEQKFHVHGWVADKNDLLLPSPALFERGLHVVLNTNVSDATVLYLPVTMSLVEQLVSALSVPPVA